jgi:hypothetical protein
MWIVESSWGHRWRQVSRSPCPLVPVPSRDGGSARTISRGYETALLACVASMTYSAAPRPTRDTRPS